MPSRMRSFCSSRLIVDREQRVAAMMVSLGTEEAAAAVEAGGGEAQVRCEFCGQEYRFTQEQVDGLFRTSAAQLPAAPGIQ